MSPAQRQALIEHVIEFDAIQPTPQTVSGCLGGRYASPVQQVVLNLAAVFTLPLTGAFDHLQRVGNVLFPAKSEDLAHRLGIAARPYDQFVRLPVAATGAIDDDPVAELTPRMVAGKSRDPTCGISEALTYLMANPSARNIWRIPRMAWRIRSWFSIKAKRTWSSPYSPKPIPGETQTLASASSFLANSNDPR